MYHLLVFAISMASMTTNARMPGTDNTCSSMRKKYQQCSWSCGPPSCIVANETSHNQLVFEKVYCDSEGKICCPSEHKIHLRNTTRAISTTTRRSPKRTRQPQRKKDRSNRTSPPSNSSIVRYKTNPIRRTTLKPTTKVTTTTPPVDADLDTLDSLDNLIFGIQPNESNSIEQESNDPSSRSNICERCAPRD